MLPRGTIEAERPGTGFGPPNPYRARHEAAAPLVPATAPDPLWAGPRRRWVRVVEAATLFTILAPLTFHALFGITASAVLSDSMRPDFAAGDLLVTRPVPATEIAVGQVAVLEDSARDIVRAHRVVWVAVGASDVSITTRGDSNPVDDAAVSVPRTASVPVVLASVPMLGHLAVLFTRPVVALIGLGLLLSADVITVLITLFPRAGTTRSKEERAAPSQEGR